MSNAAASKALLALFGVIYLLVIGDCISTYLCLTLPAPAGTNVYEANPLSALLFAAIGMVSGLLIFCLIKAVGLVILYRLAMRARSIYWTIFVGMAGAGAITLYANINNWRIYHVLAG